MFHLARLGGAQLVKFRALGEVIREEQDHIVKEQQTVAQFGVSHIGKLFLRNAQAIR